MTYCLGIVTSSGVIMAADSRTNAGVDYVSTHQKLFNFSLPGDRVILMCSSGNLSITQAIVTLLRRDISNQETPNLHTLSTMYDVAHYIGSKMRQIQEENRPWLEKDKIDYQCTLLIGGQIKGEQPTLFLLYPQGNFIEVSKNMPFFQIGETKYGKPILDRILNFNTPIEEAAKCALLSIDSTMKSNVSVGPPISLVMYETNSFKIRYELRLKLGAPYLNQIRRMWEVAIKEAFDQMPAIDWEHYLEVPGDSVIAE